MPITRNNSVAVCCLVSALSAALLTSVVHALPADDVTPSVEVHLDVLEKLGHAPLKSARTPDAASPFGKPTPPLAASSLAVSTPALKTRALLTASPVMSGEIEASPKSHSAVHAKTPSHQTVATADDAAKTAAKHAHVRTAAVIPAPAPTPPVVLPSAAIPPVLTAADTLPPALLPAPGKNSINAAGTTYPAETKPPEPALITPTKEKLPSRSAAVIAPPVAPASAVLPPSTVTVKSVKTAPTLTVPPGAGNATSENDTLPFSEALKLPPELDAAPSPKALVPAPAAPEAARSVSDAGSVSEPSKSGKSTKRLSALVRNASDAGKTADITAADAGKDTALTKAAIPVSPPLPSVNPAEAKNLPGVTENATGTAPLALSTPASAPSAEEGALSGINHKFSSFLSGNSAADNNSGADSDAPHVMTAHSGDTGIKNATAKSSGLSPSTSPASPDISLAPPDVASKGTIPAVKPLPEHTAAITPAPLPDIMTAPAAMPPKLPDIVAASSADAPPPKLPSLAELQKPADAPLATTGNRPLPALTPLTGDDAARKDAAESKVATNDLPPAAAVPPARTITPDSPRAQTAPAMAVQKSSAGGTEATSAKMPGVPEGATTAAPELRLNFSETETDVPLGSMPRLDLLAQKLTATPGTRVTVMAYASGPESAGIYPKRVALARGIAVRNYLTTNKGIDIERVNVKALGNKNEGGPADRVDIYIIK